MHYSPNFREGFDPVNRASGVFHSRKLGFRAVVPERGVEEIGQGYPHFV